MLFVCSQESMCETQYALKLLRGCAGDGGGVGWVVGGVLIFAPVFMPPLTGIHY